MDKIELAYEEFKAIVEASFAEFYEDVVLKSRELGINMEPMSEDLLFFVRNSYRAGFADGVKFGLSLTE